MIPEIYDVKDGIDLVFHIDGGYSFVVSMTDEGAQEMIDIMQNKLNARYQ